MTGNRGLVVARVREAALWLGAVLGVLCLLMAAVAWLYDVRPLVFRSDSMSPEIRAGALAIAREVPADELHDGDVVSVVSDDGTRVTHRIVGISPTASGAKLTLKGDANATPDREEYEVATAHRVWFDVPWLGRVVNAARSPWGLLLSGGFVALLLASAFGGGRSNDSGGDGRRGDGLVGPGHQPSPGTRSPVLRLAGGAGVVVALLSTGGLVVPFGTMATWNDTSAVSSESLTSLTVPPPTSPACQTNGVLLTTATVSWASPGAKYSYQLIVRDTSGTELRRDTTTSTSITYEVSLFGALLSRKAVVTIRAFPTGAAAWVSTAAITQNIRIKTLGLGVECR